MQCESEWAIDTVTDSMSVSVAPNNSVWQIIHLWSVIQLTH